MVRTSKMAALAMSAGVVAALTVPSTAAADPSADLATSPGMLAAMQRDLGITLDEAQDRIASELAASHTTEQLQSELAGAYGGAWLTDDQTLVVGITDPSHADQVTAAGAQPEVVSHSEQALDAMVDSLNETEAPAGVHGWGVDVTTNQVTVRAEPDALAAAGEFVEASGVDPAAVQIEESTEAPEPLQGGDVIGGDAYYPGSSRCSVGFSVSGGFVTAGHCGGAGTSVDGVNGGAMGSVQAASFPGNDYGWVAVNSSWTPQPLVNQYNGSAVTVAGSSQAPAGSSVCRSGSTTGWHCNEVQALNQTVTYPQGTVTGLTQTNVCAEPGDSGGSFISGDQAQGVTSGGSGNCSTGGTTFFQPVNEILDVYSLSLVTG